MSQPIFDTAKWKKQIYMELLHPGGCIPKFERKPPVFCYGSTQDSDVEIEPEIDLDSVGFEA